MWWYGWFPDWSIERDDYEVLIDGDGVTEVRKSGLFEAFAAIFNNARPGSHVRKVTSSDAALKTDMRLMNDLVAFRSTAGALIMLVNGSAAEKTYNVTGLVGTAGTLKTITAADARTWTTTPFTAHSSGKATVVIPPNSVSFIITKE
jgi:hypothetical protein